jgi:uncharacterized membrane protein YqjE
MPIPRRGQLRPLVWTVVLFDLIVTILAAWTLSNSRHQYVERAEVTTQNLALVLEQSLLANVRQIDLVLQSVRDEAERLDVATGSPGIRAHVQAQFSRVPLLDSLRTTDAEGRLEPFDQADGSPALDLSRQALFQYLRGTPQAGLFISRPSQEGPEGAWVISFARRMEHPAGVFRGVVLASVRLDRLTRELAQVDVGRLGSISLRGADLELLARYPGYPGQEKGIGNSRISGDYLVAVRSGRETRHFTTPSIIDGQVRTYTFRKVSGPVFYILVGLCQEEYLQTWRREAMLSILAVMGLVALSILLAWMARSTWRRQMASQAEREHLIDELTQALAAVKSLEGMLPICGHCKQIRDDQGDWNSLESYLSKHTDATFTHGLCPDCANAFRDEMRTRRTPKEPEGTP